MSKNVQFLLRAEEMPTHWYNLLADFPEPLPPPLHPGTREPVTPDLMTPLFPEALVAQEMSAERQIAIPEDRKSTRLNSSHSQQSRMPSSA